jgi:large subunit ribosomal protein L32
MAVQKSKVSRARRGSRRAHLSLLSTLSSQALHTDQTTGETHSRHHVTKNGYYKGKKVIRKKEVQKPESE